MTAKATQHSKTALTHPKFYITKTHHNTYQYRRRVPARLQSYGKTFKVGLGDTLDVAELRALEFNRLIDKALQLQTLDLYKEVATVLSPLMVSEIKEKSKEGDLYDRVVGDYLKTKRDTVTPTEYKTSVYTFNELLPSLFKEIMGTRTPNLNNVKYKHIESLKGRLIKLPKKNIQKYKVLATEDMIKLDVPIVERISAPTVNRYLQRFRAFLTYANKRGIIQMNYATAVPILPTPDARGQRLPLTPDEYKQLLEMLPHDKRFLVQVLAYTGMRLSELYKCKLRTIEGQLVFDLTDRRLRLKTNSSYRVIPLHTELLDWEVLEEYKKAITPNNLSVTVSKILKQIASEPSKKSLYSLRHTFATTLIQRGADTNMVSELLGHSHKGMTLSRYAKGYSIGQLQAIIQLL